MNTGSRRCWTWACAASGAWSSTSIRPALAGASRRSCRPAAGARPSTGGSAAGLPISNPWRSGELPQVNVGTILLLAVAALGGAWAAGLLRAHYEDGQLTLRVLRARRVLARFDLRDTGLLLLLSLMMGWAVAAAGERAARGPDTQGRLGPAPALGSVPGWTFAAGRPPPPAPLAAPPAGGR